METELVSQLKALTVGLPAPLQREVNMAVHKITYPMTDILAKVPGDSLTERAKKLGVSRQTMYVWMSEKFRPTRVQAKRIAKVTGVPIEHIVDDGFEGKNDAKRPSHKKTARMAKGKRKAAQRDRGAAPRRQRKATARKNANAA